MITVTKHLIGLLIVTAFLVLMFFHGCTNPMIPLVQAKYPDCQLISYDELGNGYLEARLQCGPIIKVVKMRDSRQ